MASSPPPLPEAPPFLEIDTLLDASHPHAQAVWFRYGAGILLLFVLIGAYFSSDSGDMAGVMQVVSTVVAVGLVVTISALSMGTARAHRNEQVELEKVEELIQIRQWPQAGLLLQTLLSRPMQSPYARIQALIYLAGVLSRYHRFNDAISVQEYLLEHVQLDGSTSHALRLGRAMAMLREDHLFDADHAINELRRQAFRSSEAAQAAVEAAEAEPEVADEPTSAVDEINPATFSPALDVPWKPMPIESRSRQPRSHDSAGLALVEMYRDVKTGHAAEAEGIFLDKLPVLRRQLGHRVADAYVLVARAYDLMGRSEDAAAMYEKATLLSPVGELNRRYPEVAILADRYRPAVAPAI